MRASLVLIFSFITTLTGKLHLIETVDGNFEPGKNASDYAGGKPIYPCRDKWNNCAGSKGKCNELGMQVNCRKTCKVCSDIDEKGCFPNDFAHRACPPLRAMRLTESEYYDRTTQKDFRSCWQHCKELHADYNCHVWTYQKRKKRCYTYKSSVICYKARKHHKWISGTNSI